MDDFIREMIPHEPTMGLFVSPDIPPKKVHNAIQDYAKKASPGRVVALYDATLLGSGKDGAVFLSDRFIFQNTDLQPAYDVKYEDLVEVELKKKLMGGRTIKLMVNRGRATINLELDFSGKSKAAPYVERFLQEAMHRITDMELIANRPHLRPGSRLAKQIFVLLKKLCLNSWRKGFSVTMITGEWLMYLGEPEHAYSNDALPL